MEVTETQNRLRPSLQPIWTGYDTLHGPPRSAFRAHSPSFSSPRSPRYLPSPFHPRSTSVQDSAMRKHERAMVDSLAQGARSSGTAGGQPLLSPIAEQAPGSRPGRASSASLGPRDSSKSPAFPSSSAPATPARESVQHPRRQTLVTETRNMLLSGLPHPHARSVGTSVDRHPSLPAISVPPATPASAVRRSSAAIRDQLEAWGHVYYGDAKYADCFVAAVSLRRTSDASSAEESAKGSPRGGLRDSQDPNRVTIRARVKPRAIERKPFLLQRTFNMDELRAIIPEPSPASAAFRRPSSSIDALSRSPSGTESTGCQSPASSYGRCFSSSPASQTPKSALSPSLNRSLARGGNVVPMHLKYARVHLPVLAALMMSGHVREGDVIYLPIPHPEVWSQTVARVYTGQGELTAPIKENILYLAGKV